MKAVEVLLAEGVPEDRIIFINLVSCRFLVHHRPLTLVTLPTLVFPPVIRFLPRKV